MPQPPVAALIRRELRSAHGESLVSTDGEFPALKSLSFKQSDTQITKSKGKSTSNDTSVPTQHTATTLTNSSETTTKTTVQKTDNDG